MSGEAFDSPSSAPTIILTEGLLQRRQEFLEQKALHLRFLQKEIEMGEKLLLVEKKRVEKEMERNKVLSERIALFQLLQLTSEVDANEKVALRQYLEQQHRLRKKRRMQKLIQSPYAFSACDAFTRWKIY